MIGRGRLVALMRVAILRLDSCLGAPTRNMTGKEGAENRLQCQQRRDSGDARKSALRLLQPHPCFPRRHLVFGPAAQELENPSA